jgi:hypothetical protein
VAISEEDKVRCRHHMGYGNFGSASTFVLGIPAAVQTAFVIEGAFSKILPQAEPLFRKFLDHLDCIEEQIVEDTENVAVNRVDEIELRPDELRQLSLRYQYWQGAIGNLMGITPNPWDARLWLGLGYNGGGGGINVSVIS